MGTWAGAHPWVPHLYDIAKSCWPENIPRDTPEARRSSEAAVELEPSDRDEGPFCNNAKRVCSIAPGCSGRLPSANFFRISSCPAMDCWTICCIPNANSWSGAFNCAKTQFAVWSTTLASVSIVKFISSGFFFATAIAVSDPVSLN